MRVEVIHPGELGQAEIDAWRSMQILTPELDNPFLSVDFTVNVARVRPQARAAVLTEGPDIVGFFPFERRGLGHGSPIGAGYNDCQGVVHLPGLDFDARELLRACGLAVWDFDHLAPGQRPLEAYRSTRVASPVMDFSSGFTRYLTCQQNNSKTFRGVLRKPRRLAREIGDLRFVFDATDLGALHTLMGWKSAQYLRSGWTDRFAKPSVVQLVEHLLETNSDNFSGVLSMLYAGDEPVAGHFGMRTDRTMVLWFPAYDARFGKYSPGLIMNLLLAEAAAGAGVQCLDMGPGGEPYKDVFKSRDVMVGQGQVVRRSPGAALHWARQAPSARLHRFVRENPSLHRVAKRARAGYVRADASVRRRVGTGTRDRVVDSAEV